MALFFPPYPASGGILFARPISTLSTARELGFSRSRTLASPEGPPFSSQNDTHPPAFPRVWGGFSTSAGLFSTICRCLIILSRPHFIYHILPFSIFLAPTSVFVPAVPVSPLCLRFHRGLFFFHFDAVMEAGWPPRPADGCL